jgi:TFIIF-interacting CTD phosphatase-like protein
MKKEGYIFLDLDQTLISAQSRFKDDEDEEEEYYEIDKNKKKALKFQYMNMDNYYVIFERPHLQKFLDYVFTHYNVSVWTAASQEYAMFIIEHILIKNKKNRKLDHVLFSYHGKKSSKLKKGTKDLNMLWDVYKIKECNKRNTVILDDYDEVYNTQKNNCIVAKPFYFTAEKSEKDKFLLDLIPELEKMRQRIEKKEDMRVNEINQKMCSIHS